MDLSRVSRTLYDVSGESERPRCFASQFLLYSTDSRASPQCFWEPFLQ